MTDGAARLADLRERLRLAVIAGDPLALISLSRELRWLGVTSEDLHAWAQAALEGRELPPPTKNPLSLRQRQCLSGAIQGLARRQIAKALGIKEGTVKTHLDAATDTVERIAGCAAGGSSVAAACEALRHGWISLDPLDLDHGADGDRHRPAEG